MKTRTWMHTAVLRTAQASVWVAVMIGLQGTVIADPPVQLIPERTLGLGSLVAMDVSPDGTLLATGGSLGAFVWKVGEPAPIRQFAGHQDVVTAVEFSPDGKLLLTGADWSDRAALLWDVDTGSQRGPFYLGSRIQDVAFSRDGTRIAAGGEGIARVWDLATGNSVSLAVTNAWVYNTWSVAFSPDGRRLFSGSSDNVVRIWDWEQGTATVLSNHTHQVILVRVSPAGDRLLTASYDDTAKLWDTATGEVIHTVKETATWFSGGDFSPDGAHFALVRQDGLVSIRSTDSGQEVRRLSHPEWSHTVRFGGDGTRVFTAGDSVVRAFGPGEANPISTYQGHNEAILDAAFSGQNARDVGAVSEDGRFMGWDRETGALRQSTRIEAPYSTRSAAFAGSGELVLTVSDAMDGTGDLTLRIRDASNLGSPVTIADDTIPGLGSAAAVSADGTLVAVGTSEYTIATGRWSHGIEIRLVHNGATKVELAGGEDEVATVLFAPDARSIASISSQAQVCIWDTESGVLLRSFQVVQSPMWDYSAAFLPDGEGLLIGAGQDGAARLYDSRFGTLIRTFDTEIEAMPGAKITAVAVSPNGTFAAVGRLDGRLFIFDIESGRLVARGDTSTTPIQSARFASDSASLLTGHYDGSLRVWAVGDFSSSLRVSLNNGLIDISWPSGILEQASYLAGPWTSLPGLRSPLRLRFSEAGPMQFFRVLAVESPASDD